MLKELVFAIIGLISLYGQHCLAQDDEQTFEALKKKYPEEQAVYAKYYENMDISVVEDSVYVRSRHYREMVHLGEQSTIYAKDNIYASSFYRVDNIRASTLIPYKKKFKTLKVTDFKETFDKNSQVFYDDTKVISFMYPAIAPGNHTLLEYDETISNPRFIGSFMFGNYLPIVHCKYTITVDAGIELDFKLINDTEQQVKITKQPLGVRTRYTYEAFSTKGIKTENAAPSIRYYASHLNIIIRSYKDAKGNTRNILSSANDLFAWYHTFVQGLQHQQNDTIQATVDKLVQDAPSDDEKAKRIFYWVQQNIKYIAFEDGMRGLIPHQPSYIFQKRYGDCKDMATLLVNMMYLAGIDAHFTWIGTRDIPYTYSQMPSPLVDNHMIATYISNGRHYFLDATAQYSPFNYPSSMIQSKEALIALSDSTYKLLIVPEVSKEKNVFRDTSFFRIEDGMVKGSGRLTLGGYAKVFGSYSLIRTTEKDTKDYLTHILNRGSNKFYLDQYKIKNLQNLDEPILVEYDFRVADYFRNIGDEVYFNMNMDKTFYRQYIKNDRKLPVENEYKYTYQTVSVLEIPEGYLLKHLPKDDAYFNDTMGYTIKYQQQAGKIVLTKELYLDYLLLEPNRFSECNDVIKRLSEAYSETIILKRNSI